MIFLFPRWDMLIPWRVYLPIFHPPPFFGVLKRSDFPWDGHRNLETSPTELGPQRRLHQAWRNCGISERRVFGRGESDLGWPGVDHNLIFVSIYMLGDGHQPRYYMILGVYIPILFWDSLLKVGWPFPHIATFDPSTCRLMETVKLKWA